MSRAQVTVPSNTVVVSRDVERLIAGQATSDGAGVKLTRVLTQPLQRRLDPFLMLDAFGTDNPEFRNVEAEYITHNLLFGLRGSI